jgi:hypothetical protein
MVVSFFLFPSPLTFFDPRAASCLGAALLVAGSVLGCSRAPSPITRTEETSPPQARAPDADPPPDADAAPIAPSVAPSLDVEPKEEHREIGKFCKVSVSYVAFTKLGSTDAARALNEAIAKAARVPDASCRGASAASPYEFETTVHVEDVRRPGVVELYIERRENFGGAHAFTSGACHVADLSKGTLTALRATLLTAAARAELAELTKAALASTSDLFDRDHLPIADASLCVDRDGLTVAFSAGIASAWMNGPVIAHLAASDVRPVVANTPFAPLLSP